MDIKDCIIYEKNMPAQRRRRRVVDRGDGIEMQRTARPRAEDQRKHVFECGAIDA